MSRHEEMLNKIREGAQRAFGSEESQIWLNRKSRLFDHKTPLELAQEDADRVLNFVECMTGEEVSTRH
ncbi:antitoxin Xre/MbcA/ParS toxin-binding domain-containing protein [Pseudahrensia aquimaris]|uniref:Antitoxin Xre/MbcA/ParS toxin-binding domain-containing protein n=1 Tax=Pseudahrensia aquimaris TaxID=744461 RepID=A0ABW3FJH0_9HYPH